MTEDQLEQEVMGWLAEVGYRTSAATMWLRIRISLLLKVLDSATVSSAGSSH